MSSRLRIGNTSIIIRQHTIHNNIADAMCHPDHIITILSSFYSPTDRGEHVMIAPFQPTPITDNTLTYYHLALSLFQRQADAHTNASPSPVSLTSPCSSNNRVRQQYYCSGGGIVLSNPYRRRHPALKTNVGDATGRWAVSVGSGAGGGGRRRQWFA